MVKPFNPKQEKLLASIVPGLQSGTLVHQISESEGYNDAPQAYQCGNTPHL
jgi:hypothetical protein